MPHTRTQIKQVYLFRMARDRYQRVIMGAADRIRYNAINTLYIIGVLYIEWSCRNARVITAIVFRARIISREKNVV